jgi:hypothetical protein
MKSKIKAAPSLLASLPAPDGCRVWWTVILKSEGQTGKLTMLAETFQQGWFDARSEGMTALGIADTGAVLAFKTEHYQGPQPEGPSIGWRELAKHLRRTKTGKKSALYKLAVASIVIG